ncbi:MAG TPA: PfkB family carbohydrate kinase, partial [Vicinamibacterales bacterium]|nr:PfkB family carbohydrate kinase [Vicinamibacterales bacterium]
MTRLGHLARQLGDRRVAVVGDVMLDHFVVGRAERLSPEAPVPVVRFDREDFRLGGAANVANNLVALGGRASLVGLVGDDEGAAELGRQIEAAGLDRGGLVGDRTRPTTRKTRVVTERNQQVVRIDREDDSDVSGAALPDLTARAESAVDAADAVILSDYRKGVVTPPVIAAVIARAVKRRVPVLVDPKVPDADRYRGAALVTPNHHEAELMTGRRIRAAGDARDAARTIADRTGGSVIITWGEHGIWVLDRSASTPVEAALPAVAREVADVTGAGDTVIAVIALALAAGIPLFDAARLANLAAGLVVARFGPASV